MQGISADEVCGRLGDYLQVCVADELSWMERYSEKNRALQDGRATRQPCPMVQNAEIFDPTEAAPAKAIASPKKT